MKIRKTLYIKYCTSFLFYSQKSTPLKINSNTIPLIEIRKKPIYCIILYNTEYCTIIWFTFSIGGLWRM